VSYVLVFALITTSVGVVYATGLGSLDGARDYERANNAERAFEVFADNVEDVSAAGAPSRATEIRLADASLAVGDPVTVNVTVDPGGSTRRYSYPASHPLVFETAGGTRIVYANGALFRTADGRTAMVREPGAVLPDGDGNGDAVVPLVGLRPGERTSVAGSTTVLVRTDRTSREVALVEDRGSEGVPVNVSVNTPRASAWRRYFESAGADECTVAGGEVDCRFEGAERVLVSVVEMTVELE
jgi:hypothetical protein